MMIMIMVTIIMMITIKNHAARNVDADDVKFE